MAFGILGMRKDTLLVAGSSLTSFEINFLASCKIALRAALLHGLKAKPERTGFIQPIEAGDIKSCLTNISRINAGDSFCHSCSCGSRMKSR